MCVQEIALGVIYLQRERARGFAGNFSDGIIPGLARELNDPPHFRAVHVHHPLRRPDPVVLGRPRHFGISAVGHCDLPLDAREVDAPLLAFIRRPVVTGVFGKRFPRERDFNRPALVGVGGIVQGAVDMNGGFRAGNFPRILWVAAIQIRLVQSQVPRGVKRVHLELVIWLRLASGINKHLEVGIIEDDRVVIGQRGPDVRLFELGGNVKIIVIPQQLGARAETRFGSGVTQDVHENSSPRRVRPRGFIKQTVHVDGRGRVPANIAAR